MILDLDLSFLLSSISGGDWITRFEHDIEQWLHPLGPTGEGAIRLLLAACLGGIIGLEREVRGHEAGFRTFMLVAAGAALAMIVSTSFAAADWVPAQAVPDLGEGYRLTVDPARIAYGVMTGVGFLGAGTIIQHRDRIQGLTTAAGIWSIAALGLAAGFGMYILSVLAAILLLTALLVLGWVREHLPAVNTARLVVRAPEQPDCVERFETLLREHGMQIIRTGFRVSHRRQAVLLEAEVKYFGNAKLESLRRRLLTGEEYRLLKLR